MRIRMRMGDVDGDGSYLYVCRYVYVCICAYLMQCVVLSRLYDFVGRQNCTYSYKRERGNTTKTNNIRNIRNIPTLVGVSQSFGKRHYIHYLSGSAPSLRYPTQIPPRVPNANANAEICILFQNCTASPSTLALCGYR